MHEFQVKADLCAGIDPRVSCVQCSMLRCVLAGLHKLKANMRVCLHMQVVHEYKSREKEIDQLGREVGTHKQVMSGHSGWEWEAVTCTVKYSGISLERTL